MFLSFIVCLNPNKSALVCELLSNNSLFVGQLYKDKSQRDLIFTTDLQIIIQQFTARADLFLKQPIKYSVFVNRSMCTCYVKYNTVQFLYNTHHYYMDLDIT